MKWSADPTLQRKAAHLPVPDVLAPPAFDLPNVTDMTSFQQQAMEMVKPAHGTTTLGFVYDGGIVIAVDSRATQGPSIATQTVDKVLHITPHLVGTMAGGAADVQFWLAIVGMRCRLYELSTKRRITVRAASKILANVLFSYRGMGLSIGSIVGGFDRETPTLFYVDSEGQRTEGRTFAVGSGSLYAYGVLDQGYRRDLSFDEACELGRRAIYHAGFRDAMSGGTASVFHCTVEGWKKVSGDDVSELHHKYYPDDNAVPTAGDPIIE